MRSTAARAASTAGRCLSAPEVRAQPLPQVARPAHVEDLLSLPDEEIDTGGRRRAECERALVVDAARARRREPAQVGDGPGAPFLGEADQPQENLCGRLGVGERAVARPRRGPEEVRQGAQTRPCDPAGQQASRQPDGVDHRRGEPAALDELDLAIEKADVEARVVRDENRPRREVEEALDGQHGGRSAREVSVLDPRQRGDDRGKRNPGVDQRLERARVRQAFEPDRSDLADRCAAGPEAGRLQIDDDVPSRFERQLLRRVVRERDRRPPPRESRVAADNVVEEAVCQTRGREGEREQRAGRLFCRNGRAPLLDQVDQPVGGVEGELRLHANVCSHTHRPERETGARVGPRRSFTGRRGVTA